MKQILDTAHAHAFSVAANFPVERLAAMDTLVRSLGAAATPWHIAKIALQHQCDALVEEQLAGAPA